MMAMLRNPVHNELCKCDDDCKKLQHKLGQKVPLDILVHPLFRAGLTLKLAWVAEGFAQLNYKNPKD